MMRTHFWSSFWTTVHLVDKDAEKMQTLIDALEDNDDVQNVYSNYEMDE